MRFTQVAKKILKYGELFCGPGGFALGAIKASKKNKLYTIKHAWANDIDEWACKTYAKNKWASDKKITLALEEMGYKVLRFWGTELALYPEKCFHEIIKAIKESTSLIKST